MKKLFVYLLVLTMALSTVLTAAAIDIPTNPEYNAMTADELYELAKAEGGKIVVYCTTSKIAKSLTSSWKNIRISRLKFMIWMPVKALQKLSQKLIPAIS